MEHTLSRHLETLNHYLDVTGVSELFGLTQETVYRFCRTDFLPHLKIGKSLRFDPRVLAVWIKKQESAVEYSVSERVTAWVQEHVLDRTLCLPIPSAIINVIAGLEAGWLTAAKEETNASDPTRLISLLAAFESELEAQLSLASRRELLGEILCITAVNE
jgi:predicted DNA-binding transcriptional regulator AlpA